MSDPDLFAKLDRLLLEFECFEDIKEIRATICHIHETINTTDEEIAHYCKHNEEIRDNCSNWKPTCDVLYKHENYMRDQFTSCQEIAEKDKKMYHDYICQYEDVLKQYQLKYSEMPTSHDYYEKKKENEEIQSRVLTCAEELKMNEAILREFLVPPSFPSLTKWTLHLVNLRYKTQDTLQHASNFARMSSELKKEIDEAEIEINSLNKKIARVYKTKNLSKTLEEQNNSTEKRKELKERIFEKDEHVLLFSKTPQSSQLFQPYESQKLVRPIKMHFLETKVTDKKEESSVKQSKLANIDLRQKENNTQDICTEHFGKSVESNSDKEEVAENFPQTPEIHLFSRTPEAVKTPEVLKKMQFHKTPLFEITRNTVSESEAQKESSGFSFLTNYSSRSPGLNLFDSSVSDSENSSDQFNEHHSASNVNPPSQEIGNLFGKPEQEDAFTFSFPCDTSTQTFGAGKDDFVFPFSFEQDQNSVSSPSVKGFSCSSQNTTKFTFF
ncbi:protein SIX6OS1 [Ctenodactylus gundi]